MERGVFHPVVGLPFRDVLQVAGTLFVRHDHSSPSGCQLVFGRMHGVVVGAAMVTVVMVVPCPSSHSLDLGPAPGGGRVVTVLVGAGAAGVDTA